MLAKTRGGRADTAVSVSLFSLHRIPVSLPLVTLVEPLGGLVSFSSTMYCLIMLSLGIKVEAARVVKVSSKA